MTNYPLCSRRGLRVCRLAGRDESGPDWQIWSCSGCNCGWIVPRVEKGEIGCYYSPTYHSDVRNTLTGFLAGRLQKSKAWRREIEKVKQVEKHFRGGRLLEAGCADAKFLLALDASRCWDRTGVENLSETVRIVRSLVLDLRIVDGEIFFDELRPGAFDAITFWHVFEHLHEPRPGS